MFGWEDLRIAAPCNGVSVIAPGGCLPGETFAGREAASLNCVGLCESPCEERGQRVLRFAAIAAFAAFAAIAAKRVLPPTHHSVTSSPAIRMRTYIIVR